MNGGQDLGGVMGLGPVAPEPDEPRFHAAWERRAFAMAVAMGTTGAWTIDMARSCRESIHPAEYMRASYYTIWFKALERLVEARGLVSAQELAEGRALAPAAPVKRVIPGEEMPAALRRGWPSDRPAATPARFAAGDAVRARNIHPRGHTRLPRYVRGHRGTVVRAHGVFVFPDAAAHDGGEQPQWLYTVRFEGAELWGPDGEPGIVVSVDAWESYLEPV